MRDWYDMESDVQKRLPNSEENGISPAQLSSPMKVMASYIVTLVHLTQNNPVALAKYINDLLNHDLSLKSFIENRVSPLCLPSKSREHKKLGEVLYVLKKVISKDEGVASSFVKEISLSKGALLTVSRQRKDLTVKDLKTTAKKNFLDKLSCMLEDSLIDLNGNVMKAASSMMRSRL